MLKSIAKAWGAVKDGAMESAIKVFINQKIKSFGNVTKLQIDSAEKKMLLEVELKGEVAPVAINVGAYDVIERNQDIYIALRQVSASREWIGTALNEYVVGRQIKLPDAAKRFLKAEGESRQV